MLRVNFLHFWIKNHIWEFFKSCQGWILITLHILQKMRFWKCDFNHTLAWLKSELHNIQELLPCFHESNHNIHDVNHSGSIWITDCLTRIRHGLHLMEFSYVIVIRIRGFHDSNHMNRITKLIFYLFLDLDTNHLISWPDSYSLLMTQIK